MKQVISASIAVLEGLSVALTSAIILAICAVVFWVAEFGFGADMKPLGAVVGALWLLGHGVSLGVPLSSEAATALHFEPEQIMISLSLPMTGVLLLTVARAVVYGWRLTSDVVTQIVHIVFAIIGFGIVTAVMVILAHPVVSVPLWWAILLPMIIAVVCCGIGAFARALLKENLWAAHISPWFTERKQLSWLGDTLFAAGVLASRVCMGIVVLSGAMGAVSIITHFTEQLRVMQALQLDLPGVFVFGIGTLFYLPTVLIWGIAWLSGAGFAVGTGSSVSPFGRLTPPLPELPAFAMLPQGWGGAAVVAPLLLVAVVAFIAALSGKRVPWVRAPWWQMLISALFVGIFVGVIVLSVALFSSGAIGPGRLAETGPNALFVAGLLAGYSFIGVLIGAGGRRLDSLWIEPLTSFVEDKQETRKVRREERWTGLGEPYDSAAQTTVVIDAEKLTEQYSWDTAETQAEVIDFATGKVAENPVPAPVYEPVQEQTADAASDDIGYTKPVHDSVLFDNELPDPMPADEIAAEEAMRAFEWSADPRVAAAQETIQEIERARAGTQKTPAPQPNKRKSWRFWQK